MVEAINANKIADQESKIEVAKESPKADRLQKRVEELSNQLHALQDQNQSVELELKGQ